MNASVQTILPIVLIAFTTTAGGFWIASRKPAWYSQEKLRWFVAVGTGLLLAVALIEFLFTAFQLTPRQTPFLIIAGILFILFVETYLAPHLNFFEGHDCHHDHAKSHDEKEKLSQEHTHHLISHEAACSALGCLIICAFFDGFEIRTAFSVGSTAGWTTAMGLLFHVLPDGVLAAGIALAGGMTVRRTRLVSALTGGLLILGALTASVILEVWPQARGWILPFSTGVLLYVVLMHLLPVGMKHRRGFFWILTGALFFSALHFLTHRH